MKEEAKVKVCEQEEVNGMWMQVFGSELKGQEAKLVKQKADQKQ